MVTWEGLRPCIIFWFFVHTVRLIYECFNGFDLFIITATNFSGERNPPFSGHVIQAILYSITLTNPIKICEFHIFCTPVLLEATYCQTQVKLTTRE